MKGTIISIQISRWIFLFVLIVSVTTFLPSCGPTLEEIRSREQAREKEQETLRNRQESLKKKYEERINAGELGPPKVEDLGYSVVTCIYPRPPEDYCYITNDKFTWGYICGNTPQGKEIIAWRKWYCKGEDASCVLSRWKNGQPTFGEVVKTTTTIMITRDIGFKIGPIYDW